MGKQRRAIAPNFVHSHDAALVHNVVSCTKVPVMTVHDCYMCLASDADTLNMALRTQVHETYHDTDWLAEMETALDCKIDVPFGSLDFSQVLGSEYMFS
jgi:DNA-directed RNA polymerase